MWAISHILWTVSGLFLSARLSSGLPWKIAYDEQCLESNSVYVFTECAYKRKIVCLGWFCVVAGSPLDEHIRYFEPVNYDVKIFQEHHRRAARSVDPTEISVAFQAYGK